MVPTGTVEDFVGNFVAFFCPNNGFGKISSGVLGEVELSVDVECSPVRINCKSMDRQKAGVPKVTGTKPLPIRWDLEWFTSVYRSSKLWECGPRCDRPISFKKLSSLIFWEGKEVGLIYTVFC